MELVKRGQLTEEGLAFARLLQPKNRTDVLTGAQLRKKTARIRYALEVLVNSAEDALAEFEDGSLEMAADSLDMVAADARWQAKEIETLPDYIAERIR